MSAGNRQRGEQDFYLGFFVQSHAMIDWLVETGLMDVTSNLYFDKLSMNS